MSPSTRSIQYYLKRTVLCTFKKTKTKNTIKQPVKKKEKKRVLPLEPNIKTKVPFDLEREKLEPEIAVDEEEVVTAKAICEIETVFFFFFKLKNKDRRVC